MHACLHGIVGKLLGLWFDPEHHNTPFYIGRPAQIHLIDSRITMVRLPSIFPRKPRVIGDRAFYKASEELAWLFYYGGACLDNILPTQYLQHFQLFASAIFTLDKDKISDDDMKKCERKLDQFLTQFPKLYGSNNEVFNVHLITHIIQSVVNCGPLWCYSTFSFENMNGVLKKFVNGTTDVMKQIATKYLLNAKLNGNPAHQSFFNKKNRKKCEDVAGVLLFGASFKPDVQLLKIMNDINSQMDTKNTKLFRSCSINSQLVKCYSSVGETDDSVIKTKDDEFHRVFNICKFNGEVSPNVLHTEHLHSVLGEGELELLPVENFAEKCVHIRTSEHYSFISQFCNTVERY